MKPETMIVLPLTSLNRKAQIVTSGFLIFNDNVPTECFTTNDRTAVNDKCYKVVVVVAAVASVGTRSCGDSSSSTVRDF
jgi:hypothetical protein